MGNFVLFSKMHNKFTDGLILSREKSKARITPRFYIWSPGRMALEGEEKKYSFYTYQAKISLQVQMKISSTYDKQQKWEKIWTNNSYKT